MKMKKNIVVFLIVLLVLITHITHIGKADGVTLFIETQPQSVRSGQLMSVQPIIHVLDGDNNIVLTDNTTDVTVSISSGEGGSLTGTTTVTAENGVVTFTDLILSGVSFESYVIAFDAPGFATVYAGEIIFKSLDSFSTLDGFGSFLVTGDVQVSTKAMLYNARDSQLVADVTVRMARAGNFNRNSIVVYHVEEGNSQEVDRVSTNAYKDSYPDAGGTIDNDFVFDLDSGNPQKSYQITFQNTTNMQVIFALSTYISITN